jgi:hypothetical protein
MLQWKAGSLRRKDLSAVLSVCALYVSINKEASEFLYSKIIDDDLTEN